MKYRIDKSFARDVDKLTDKAALKKLQDLIGNLDKAQTLREIVHLKKIEGFDSFYRVKIGDYRLGMEVSGKELVFIRFLHRKDIYRYFPKRGSRIR